MFKINEPPLITKLLTGAVALPEKLMFPMVVFDVTVIVEFAPEVLLKRAVPVAVGTTVVDQLLPLDHKPSPAPAFQVCAFIAGAKAIKTRATPMALTIFAAENCCLFTDWSLKVAIIWQVALVRVANGNWGSG